MRSDLTEADVAIADEPPRAAEMSWLCQDPGRFIADA